MYETRNIKTNIYPEIEPLLDGSNHITPNRKPLFKYTDTNNQGTEYLIVDIKNVPSGSEWITSTGKVLEPNYSSPAYQYYKMDTEFMECYESIDLVYDPMKQNNNNAKDRALAYISYKWFARIESHLDTIRALQVFWTIISVILIIVGIVLGIRDHMFH